VHTDLQREYTSLSRLPNAVENLVTNFVAAEAAAGEDSARCFR